MLLTSHAALTNRYFKKSCMKKIILLTIIVVLTASKSLSAQIKFFALGRTYPDNVESVPETGGLEPMGKVTDPNLQKIMSGFRRTNIAEIREYLCPKLQDDISIIDSLFNTYEEKYLNLDSIYLHENAGYAIGEEGVSAITMFTHKSKGSLTIEYQYLRLRKMVVNKIYINGELFPKGIDHIYHLEMLLQDKSLNDKEKLKAYKELRESLTPKEGQEMNEFCLPQNKNNLSTMNGNMSWYALISGENQLAIETAEEGLRLNPKNIWINTNLALGLAQTGQIDKASEIYLSLKDEMYKRKSFKELFLTDIEDLESKGISVTHKKKIHELLNGK